MAIGQAYGFFKCTKSKDDIVAELPQIRANDDQIPSELELTVLQGAENVITDETVRDMAAFIQREQGTNYILGARLPGATNLRTAREVTQIFNLAYASPLFEKGERMTAFVAYEDETGRYRWLEE
ncbi:MAG TPA: hypothetical protein VJB87_02945 [Candidatus Nanoarchaeia archaeon]|nr:hypothetical protein [Candidatus Nanoarchaeia archaeon]